MHQVYVFKCSGRFSHMFLLFSVGCLHTFFPANLETNGANKKGAVGGVPTVNLFTAAFDGLREHRV